MKHQAVAYHLGKRTNLNRIYENFEYEILKSEHSFILFKINHNSWGYLKDYGSIVFINADTSTILNIIEFITEEKFIENEYFSENYTINVDEKKPIHVGFSDIVIPKLTTDFAHVVMLNLAESVALDNYYNMSLNILENVKEYANELEQTGVLKLTRKKVRIFIAKTMNVKNSIAENLFIFETSNVAWSTKELSFIDTQMSGELEIVDRHHGLQQNLNVISENLDFFKDVLQHRHSSNLEWIIILLILFEIVQVLVEKIFL